MSVKHLDITGVIKNVVPGVYVKHLDVIVVLIGAICSWSADKPSQEEEKKLCHPQRHAYKPQESEMAAFWPVLRKC